MNGTETYTLGLHRTQSNLDVARRENAVIIQEKNYQQTYKGFNPNSPLATIMLANYQHAFMASSINFAEKVERSFRREAERRRYENEQRSSKTCQLCAPDTLDRTHEHLNSLRLWALCSTVGRACSLLHCSIQTQHSGA